MEDNLGTDANESLPKGLAISDIQTQQLSTCGQSALYVGFFPGAQIIDSQD